MGGEIFQDTAALAGAQLSGIAIKEDLKPKKKTNDIPDKKVYCGRDLSGSTKGKTAAIEFVVPYQVYGYGNNEGKQHDIDNQRSRSGVDTKDQGGSCKKLDIWQEYGNQIYERIRKKIVPINNFCKMCRFNNLVITGNKE
jgi:hypothetical protein